MEISLTVHHRYEGNCLYKKRVTYNLIPSTRIKDYLKQFKEILSLFNPHRFIDYGIIPKEDTEELETSSTSIPKCLHAASGHKVSVGLPVKTNCADADRHNARRENYNVIHRPKRAIDSVPLAQAAMESETSEKARTKPMEDMSHLINRLATFHWWPENNFTPTVPLASFGFYYTGHLDKVKCFECGTEIEGWSGQDKPEVKHKNVHPDCPLVEPYKRPSKSTASNKEAEVTSLINTKEDSKDTIMNGTVKHTSQGNHEASNDKVPPQDTPRTDLPTAQNGRQNGGTGNSSMNQSSTTKPGSSDNKPVIQENTLSQSVRRPMILRSTSQTLHAIATTTPTTGENWFSLRDNRDQSQVTSQSVDYTIEMNRLASFLGNWPTELCVQPLELAAAGLFFTGPGDRVQCAWCRGGLHGWEEGDTAIGEHRRHFPQCTFIKNKIYEMIRSPTTRQEPQQQEEDVTPAPHNSSWNKKHDKTVDIIRRMGYSTDILEKAIQKLNGNGETITVSSLLDVIFEIEEPGGEGTSDHATSDHYTNTRTVEMVKNESSEDETFVENTVTGVTDTDETAKIAQLSAENTRLKGKMVCKVCLDEEVGVLFLPCRHLVCCAECGAAVKHCPVCRTLIVGTVKPFLNRN